LPSLLAVFAISGAPTTGAAASEPVLRARRGTSSSAPEDEPSSSDSLITRFLYVVCCFVEVAMARNCSVGGGSRRERAEKGLRRISLSNFEARQLSRAVGPLVGIPPLQPQRALRVVIHS